MSINHETILFVDLKMLEYNYKYIKSKLSIKTEIIAVVKAFAYGHGDSAIAKKLEKLGVYAFWVADFEEGISLRKSGISIPIIIANPGSKSYNSILKYNLEPVIYNFRLLKMYGEHKNNVNIHVKFNSGMNRYGFELEDINKIDSMLRKYSHLNVETICTHLSCANNKLQDRFTHSQLEKFEKINHYFYKKTQINVKKHILNTAGVLRFTKYENDMVRVGIGLYGISEDKNLHPIAKLKSTIVQVRNIKKNEKIGYNGEFIAVKNMKIGVVPVGYADGINRKLSNGSGYIIINNKKAKIIGEISMDSMLIDITNTKAKEGDVITIFDKNNDVLKIANSLGTIPYEIFATLNKRVKRVYSE